MPDQMLQIPIRVNILEDIDEYIENNAGRLLKLGVEFDRILVALNQYLKQTHHRTLINGGDDPKQPWVVMNHTVTPAVIEGRFSEISSALAGVFGLMHCHPDRDLVISLMMVLDSAMSKGVVIT